MAIDEPGPDARSHAAPSVARETPAGSLVVFFLLTFAVTWACFVPVAVSIPVRSPLGSLLVFLGAISPSFVALALTARARGRTGVRALVWRVFLSRVAARWYAFAAGYIAAIELATALVHRIVTSAWPRFGDLPWYLIPFAIAISTPFQAGEEIGWRGYALPRLAARFGLAPASILLGVFWALWHLPLFFAVGTDTYGQSFVFYLLQVIALSVTIAWLYANTGGSLLLPMLLHAAVNNSKDIVPSAMPGGTDTFGFAASRVGWITLILLWAGAALFLAWMVRTERRRAGEYGRYIA